MVSELTVYERPDRRWAWRLKADNGQIVATNGGEGYPDESSCQFMAEQIVINGGFRDAVRRRTVQEPALTAVDEPDLDPILNWPLRGLRTPAEWAALTSDEVNALGRAPLPDEHGPAPDPATYNADHPPRKNDTSAGEVGDDM
jgi:uncharacterized protein YegP (UPF0339 family)